MKLLIIFATSAVLLQYHFAATAPNQGGSESESSKSEGLFLLGMPDNYQIKEKIGSGAFADVYSAIHRDTGVYVAIKAIYKAQFIKVGSKNLFKEPHNMEGLNHPYIVNLFQIIETRKHLYLAMEYASGGDLFEYLKEKGAMTETEARFKFRQMVSAVQYLHKKNIIHRDLKPKNLVLSGEKIKITDFGLSTQFEKGLKLSTFVGSKYYSAPEVLRGEEYDGPEADVWSLGAILHNILTGSVPFGGKNKKDVLNNIEKGYRPPNDVSEPCKDLLRRILEVDPTKRISLEDVRKHSWINIGFEHDILKQYIEPKPDPKHQDKIKESLVKEGYERDEIEAAISEADYCNELFAHFLILGGKIPKAPGSPYLEEAHVPSHSVPSIPIRTASTKKPQGA